MHALPQHTAKRFNNYFIYTAWGLFFLCISIVGYTQPAPSISVAERRANNLFYALRYVQAIDAYESIRHKKPLSKESLQHLAASYRKVNDYAHAEKIYAELTASDSLTSENFLYYAQSLSANQQYDSARIAYQHYAHLQSNDGRGQAFANAYKNINRFFKDSASMDITLLNINSGQSDFSPAYYQKGLIFCSNRKEGQLVKHVFEWNQSAFLDLYYVDDTASLKKAKETNATVGDSQKKKQRTNDDDTYPTSNDNGTTGYMNYTYKDTSGLFAETEISIKRFAKTLSTKYHEGPLVFFSNQDSVIFTRNNFDNGKYKKGADGINKLKLYSASFAAQDSSWQHIKSLPFNSDNYATGHPAIAPGDSILYFVSDMPGGMGGTDIYRSFLRNGNWSAPENIGAPINTEGNELFPFIDRNNQLYFASDGHPGLGGLDIFKTSLTKQGAVQNIGYPANSSFDDFGFIYNPDTKTGYFSSNRRRGLGDDDIYGISIKDLFYIQVVDGLTKTPLPLSAVKVSAVQTHEPILTDSSAIGTFKVGMTNTLKYEITGQAFGYASNTIYATANVSNPTIIIPLYKPDCIVEGTITDKDTKLPVEGALITIYDITLKDTIYSFTVEYSGKYKYVNLKPNHQYSLHVTREGYFYKSPIQINTRKQSCGTTIEKEYDYLADFEMEKIILGRAIKIENIYFDLAKYTIRTKAAKELDKIVKLMEENPYIIIELSSHTDCRSSFQYNMTLSDNRAKASANYIISKGISADRITGKGYGETKLVNDCACEGKTVSRTCSEAEHQANRRTEFQVTGFLSDPNTRIEKSSGEQSATPDGQ
jgi:outer membrane protein OmpA-like peptidoglycan-associated protein